MVDYLNGWVQNIIIAVIISIIIEMILPDNDNKKYVKVVTGLYILYIIVSPFFGLKAENKMKEIESLITNTEKISTVSESDIVNTYILSLENALKAQITESGFKVENLKLYITSDYSQIAKVEIKMQDENYDESKIIEIIQSNYDIDKNNIIIN